jgi:hypothetical protein
MTFPSAPTVSVVVLCFGNEYPSENLNSATSLHASETHETEDRDDAGEWQLPGKQCGDGCGREGPSGTSLHARPGEVIPWHFHSTIADEFLCWTAN